MACYTSTVQTSKSTEKHDTLCGTNNFTRLPANTVRTPNLNIEIRLHWGIIFNQWMESSSLISLSPYSTGKGYLISYLVWEPVNNRILYSKMSSGIIDSSGLR